MKSQSDFTAVLLNNKGFLLFTFFVVVSLFMYKDYGISWDEPCQQEFGELGYERIFEQKINPEYNITKQKYGIAFEVVLVVVQKMFSLTKSSDIYHFRHFFTHITFLFSAFVFYLILKNSSLKKVAFLGFLLLVISPRIYAHSFFNPKDIPLLSFTIFSVYFLQKYLYLPKITHLILFAFFCAYTLNIRVIGGFIPCILFFLYFFELKEISRKKKLQHGAIFSVLFLCLSVLLWPLLWNNPIQSFIEAFSYFGDFYWDDSVIFRGDSIIATNLPWYYSFYYIFSTTPILYLIGFSGGMILMVKQFVNNNTQKETIIFFFLFFFPLLSIIIINSVVYDGWRHMFYTYPALLFFALLFINFLIEKFQKKKVFFIIGIFIIQVVWQMFSLYPYQHIYFNELIPKSEIRNNYELDYWGTGFIEGIYFILDYSNKNKIKIHFSNSAGIYNKLLLSEKEKKRIEVVNSTEEADFFITNYRYHPSPYTAYKEVYSVKRYNTEILSVFKVN